MSDPATELERGVRSLIGAERLYTALELASLYLHREESGTLSIPTELFLEILHEATRFDPRTELGGPKIQELTCTVTGVLDVLERRGVQHEELAAIEWAWLPLLEHSQRGLTPAQPSLL